MVGEAGTVDGCRYWVSKKSCLAKTQSNNTLVAVVFQICEICVICGSFFFESCDKVTTRRDKNLRTTQRNRTFATQIKKGYATNTASNFPLWLFSKSFKTVSALPTCCHPSAGKISGGGEGKRNRDFRMLLRVNSRQVRLCTDVPSVCSRHSFH